jgi:hypothetical protein
MWKRHRLLVGPAILVVAACVASAFTGPKDQPASPKKAAADEQPVAQGDTPEPTLLAARYHLRKRTTRFFQRAKGYHRFDRGNRYDRRRSITPAPRPAGAEGEPASAEQPDLAARYHLRTRTTRFFQRAIAADLSAPKDLQLAARYHLRTRTTRFFQRAVAADLTASQDLHLAARYHLRTRTTRFFQRAVA